MPSILNEDGTPHKNCPVKSYKLYLDHLSEKCKWLWQTANPAGYLKGNHVWYKNSRMGESNIATFMSNLSKLVGLSYKYTNHCVRVTGATNLTRANFTSNQIMSITGHKLVNALAMYQRVNSNEKLMMGMSLAFNLFRPVLVQQQLEGFSKAQREEIKYGEKRAIATPETQRVPYTPPQPIMNVTAPITEQNRQEDMAALVPVEKNIEFGDSDFDILDFINDNNDEEILLAATQMEKEYATATTTTVVTTTNTTVMKKSPKKLPTMPTFTGCKIENIHFHFHK